MFTIEVPAINIINLIGLLYGCRKISCRIQNLWHLVAGVAFMVTAVNYTCRCGQDWTIGPIS